MSNLNKKQYMKVIYKLFFIYQNDTQSQQTYHLIPSKIIKKQGCKTTIMSDNILLLQTDILLCSILTKG